MHDAEEALHATGQADCHLKVSYILHTAKHQDALLQILGMQKKHTILNFNTELNMLLIPSCPTLKIILPTYHILTNYKTPAGSRHMHYLNVEDFHTFGRCIQRQTVSFTRLQLLEILVGIFAHPFSFLGLGFFV